MIGKLPMWYPYIRKVNAQNHQTTDQSHLITCIICELFEHIIASHIMQHLEDNNILYAYDLQHGFRRKRSCESQLLSLVHKLMHNYDNNMQSDLIQMDLAKAFDKVPHK